MDTDLSDDARMEAGFAAFALRFDAETSDYTGIIDAMTQAVAPVQAAIETIIDPAVEGLNAALEFIEDLVEPIDFLEGLEALARPFISAVSTMASPINAFFDFLEDPPRVFGIRVGGEPAAAVAGRQAGHFVFEGLHPALKIFDLLAQHLDLDAGAGVNGRALKVFF